MSEDKSNDPVVIVGSGPAGMVTAAGLAMRGVPVRVVDRMPAPLSTSRAFTIHARTLEQLEQLDLVDTFHDHGVKTYSMDYHFPHLGEEELPGLDFRELDSAYPYYLTIEQAETEAILRRQLEELGVTIEWSTEVTGFHPNPDRVDVELSSNGRAETISTRWLLGCDGAHSTIRNALDIPFDGDDYEGTMRMIDAPVTGLDLAPDAVHYFVAKEQLLLIARLPSGNHRLLISDRNEDVTQPPPDEARRAFQALIDGRLGTGVEIGPPEWATTFRLARRKVDSFRHGRIFLIGDSAHINSPAGGQGMNVAMQDGLNLGWKLALVTRGEAPVSLLDTYETERGPVADQVLEGTNYFHSIIMAHGQGMAERIERLQADGWNSQAVNQIAGISYSYAGERAGPGPIPGDRAPDAPLGGGRRIYDLIDVDRPTVLLAVSSTSSATARSPSAEIGDELRRRYVAPPVVAAVDGRAFHDSYDCANGGSAVVARPDRHIAHRGPIADMSGLRDSLDSMLVRR